MSERRPHVPTFPPDTFPLVRLGQGDYRRDLRPADVAPHWFPRGGQVWQRLLNLWLYRDLHRAWPLARCVECGRRYWRGWLFAASQEHCSTVCFHRECDRLMRRARTVGRASVPASVGRASVPAGECGRPARTSFPAPRRTGDA